MPVATRPRNDATWSCWRRYSGEKKLVEYRPPSSSSSDDAAEGGQDRRIEAAREREGGACVDATSREDIEPVPHPRAA